MITILLQVLEILKTIFIILLITVLLMTIFLFKGDIKTKIPKKIKKNYKFGIKQLNKRNIFMISPKEVKNTKKIILYLHGGSYVMELNNKHWNFLSDIVDDTDSTIIIPDYPLTPKYNYKDVFNMVEPLYKNILENKSNKEFIVMGDSAGGGLALALVQKMGEDGIEMPDKTILLSPWLDVTLKNPDISKIEPNDPILNRLALKISGENYAGKDRKDLYLVSPINGPLEKLKNVTIFTGTYDILDADVKLLQKNANEKGIKIDVREYEKAVHVWMLNRYAKKNSYMAEEAYQEIIALLKK